MNLRVGITCYFWNKKTDSVDSFVVTDCDKKDFKFLYHNKIYTCSYTYANGKIFENKILLLGHHSIEEIEKRSLAEGKTEKTHQSKVTNVEVDKPKEIRVLSSYDHGYPNYSPLEETMVVFGD